ncbi:RNA polymerase sigma factor [Mucilaginibacter gracilis]|uniref:RNA polymerase sigma factor n=1 Tax=Mucilaginibacter gracilis TaxID=423350 RepID=UPI0021D392A4|nr:sigma-70 family RNA polymerase sigma factor [Mucilaginibacter gracilis]
MESLYKLYANTLYNYGSKFTDDKDLIKECIQELFVTVWTRREYLSEPPNVRNYLFKAFRLSLFKKGNMLQKQVRYEETEHYDFHASITIEEEIITGEDNAVLQRRLQATLDQLTARQREAIFLKFYEGLSYEEIAEIMDISVKGAYKVMARAIDALRDKLDPDDFLLLLTLFSLKLFH